MVFLSKCGGELMRIPLNSLIQTGRGDDIFVVVDHETHSKYGTLGIGNNTADYEVAKVMAENWRTGEPIMVAVEDSVDGSPLMLTRELRRDGKKFNLAVVFNARFADNPEENRRGSFCLRLSSALDPFSKVSERIIYAPGEVIDWNADQVARISDLLDAVV